MDEDSEEARRRRGPGEARCRYARGAGATEERECPVVRVDHHFLDLARIRLNERHPAVAKADSVGCCKAFVVDWWKIARRRTVPSWIIPTVDR